MIPYENLTDSAVSTENNYISGESKEISIISILVIIIFILLVIYLLIWGIYNYIYRKIIFNNINLG